MRYTTQWKKTRRKQRYGKIWRKSLKWWWMSECVCMCVCCVCMCLKQNQCLLQSNKQNSRFERAIENGFGVVLVVCKQFKLLIVGRTTHTHSLSPNPPCIYHLRMANRMLCIYRRLGHMALGFRASVEYLDSHCRDQHQRLNLIK